eukprot:TRINITY_DN10045_c0_g1_i3.p2 TRINITY_DN10045_c0_g1~~TRINITY_DN10045_c0_g1_i3.p2  ORF type:complete len:132 (+),score=28.48 TRINITY_DN10045_c0_g1_i3:544-939(+)
MGELTRLMDNLENQQSIVNKNNSYQLSNIINQANQPQKNAPVKDDTISNIINNQSNNNSNIIPQQQHQPQQLQSQQPTAQIQHQNNPPPNLNELEEKMFQDSEKKNEEPFLKLSNKYKQKKQNYDMQNNSK